MSEIYTYKEGDLCLFDIDRTLVNSDHRCKYDANGRQCIDSFRYGNPEDDHVMIDGDAIKSWVTVPINARGVMTSRVLNGAEKRALRRMGVLSCAVQLSRPENSPLRCEVLKTNLTAQILRKAHNWKRLVFWDDSLANVQAVRKTCEVFSMPFLGFHVIHGLAIEL